MHWAGVLMSADCRHTSDSPQQTDLAPTPRFSRLLSLSCHYFMTHPLERGFNIGAVKDIRGYNNVMMNIIYTGALDFDPSEARSPAEGL